MEKKLSEKDIKKRDLMLSGDMWKVVLSISAPIAIYQWLQQFFKVFDMMIAAHVSPMSVSAVSYLSQISNMVTAVGTGLAIGSSIKISEAYGAGDFEDVHKKVNMLYRLCSYVAIIIFAIIPFSKPILFLLATPQDFIAEGSIYFGVILLDCIVNLYGTAYISVQRVRGNTMRILILNIMVFIIKLTLSSVFVFGLGMGITSIGIATLLSNSVLLLDFLYIFCYKNKGDIFSISSYTLNFDKKTAKPLLSMSTPVVAEKFCFQLGKYIVISMSTFYGTLVSGALGISNNIGGMVNMLQMGFQDAGSSIISQNVGAGYKKRSLDAFYKLLIINVIIGIVGYLIATTYLPTIASFFDGGDPEFSQLIQEIYLWEAYGTVPLGVFAAVSALLYGYGYTKLTLILNFLRLFALRVPVLYLLQEFTDLGTEAVGIAMCISNAGTGILGGIVSIFVITHIKKQIKSEEMIEFS